MIANRANLPFIYTTVQHAHSFQQHLFPISTHCYRSLSLSTPLYRAHIHFHLHIASITQRNRLLSLSSRSSQCKKGPGDRQWRPPRPYFNYNKLVSSLQYDGKTLTHLTNARSKSMLSLPGQDQGFTLFAPPEAPLHVAGIFVNCPNWCPWILTMDSIPISVLPHRQRHGHNPLP